MTATTLAQIAEGLAGSGDERDFPKYRQIIDALVDAIEVGTLGPGDRLPPEIEMAELFSVSPGTVQKALTHLADNGFVERSRRRGTFVTGRQAEEVFVFRFRNPETGEIYIPFTRVLAVAEADPDGAWRQFLPEATRCVRVDRLVWVEGESPAYSEFHIPYEYAGHLLEEPIENLHGASFHKILGERFNLPTLRTSHRLQARRLSDAACSHLLLPDGTFGTVWDAVAYSYRQAITYQLVQVPAGHRPIELDVVSAAPPVPGLPMTK